MGFGKKQPRASVADFLLTEQDQSRLLEFLRSTSAYSTNNIPFGPTSGYEQSLLDTRKAAAVLHGQLVQGQPTLPAVEDMTARLHVLTTMHAGNTDVTSRPIDLAAFDQALDILAELQQKLTV